MRILLDVDGVVADFIGAVFKIRDGHDLNRGSAKTYDWFKEYPGEDGDRVLDAMTGSQFWRNLGFIHQAVEGVDFLRSKGHKIVWCTCPYKACPTWTKDRTLWLEDNFQRSEHKEPLVFTRDKWLIGAHVMIDDRADWVAEWQEEHPASLGLVFGTELNRHVKNTLTWEDIMNMELFNKERKEYV